ncbi:MAG: hypothetical protein WBF06_01025 [Candidatus Acidiferrales bacterium]
MKRNILALASVLALTLAFGFAARAQDQPANANVAGAWQITWQGRNGTVTNTLTFTQDGATLTGTMHGDRGDAPVNGTITGSAIDFTIKRSTPNGDFTSEYKGTVTGDTIKGTVMMGQNSRDWSATRQKASAQ